MIFFFDNIIFMKLLTLLITFSVFLFSSCSEEKQTNSTQQNIEGEIVQEEIALSELTQRNDLYYKKFSDEPYTGKVTDANSTGFIKDGKKEGTSLELDKKTMLWVKYNYKDGVKRIGGYYNYDKKGCGEDACKEVLMNGLANGDLNYTDFITDAKSGKKFSGLLVEFDQESNLIQQYLVQDGIELSVLDYSVINNYLEYRWLCDKQEKNGLICTSYTFHENGNLERKYSDYSNLDQNKTNLDQNKNGKIGEETEYDKFGNLTKKANWKDNVLNGEYIEYHDRGTLKSKGSFNMGKRVGDWVYYDRKGNLITCEEQYVHYKETSVQYWKKTLKEMCN